MQNNMKIIITGTAGFIGFHLAAKLLAENHKITGIDNINDYYDLNLKYKRLETSGIEAEKIEYGKFVLSKKNNSYSFVKADLEDKERILNIFEEIRPDIVINLAAQAGVRYSITNPDTYISSNIRGFLNILEACRKYPVKHLIYASSSSVYGLNKKMPFSVHHNVDHPVSLYAVSKKSNELMAHSYSHLYGIPSTGLRFFTVYGPWGRPDMALFLFTRAILNGEEIKVFNEGKMERDFTFIDDIVNGIEKIIWQPPTTNSDFDALLPDPAFSSAPYRIYNIGNNNPVKLLDFIKAIENSTGMKAKMDMQPMQAGDVEKTWADVSDLINDFNYEPYTPVQEGIDKFVKWFREYYKI